jgi:hypothetical protein
MRDGFASFEHVLIDFWSNLRQERTVINDSIQIVHSFGPGGFFSRVPPDRDILRRLQRGV